MAKFAKQFHKALKLRKLDHLSVRKLSILFNVSPTAAHRWRAGHDSPSNKNAENIALILGVSVGWLIFNEGFITRFDSLSKTKRLKIKALYQ